MAHSRISPGDGLLHPLTLVAVLVLLLNDHWGKATWPGAVTGKLSDVAGLLFFPIMLQATWEHCAARWSKGWRPSMLVLTLAVLATIVVFSLVKLWPPAGNLYRVGVAALQWPARALASLLRGSSLPVLAPVQLTADPTDLIALPAAVVAAWLGHRRVGADQH